MTCSASSASRALRQAATSDVAWFRRILALRSGQRSDWMISERLCPRFLVMTNDTTPTENGVADAAMLAAQISTNETLASTETPAEPKPPSFDDLGLHPDVKQALDDMGYFAPTPVQTAVFKPVSEGK